MKDKDLNQIAAVEKAIAEKYGAEAVANPKANWDEIKEKEYLKQMKELYQKHKKNEEASEKIHIKFNFLYYFYSMELFFDMSFSAILHLEAEYHSFISIVVLDLFQIFLQLLFYFAQ